MALNLIIEPLKKQTQNSIKSQIFTMDIISNNSLKNLLTPYLRIKVTMDD